MRLSGVHVRNFRSIEDSEFFTVEDITCLVGKNEAGKTALLHALLGANPLGDFKYDQLRDYPRRYVTRFEERHPDKRSEVAATTWELDDGDVTALESLLGPNCLKKRTVVLHSGIGYSSNTWTIDINQSACLDHLVAKHKLDASERKPLKDISDTAEAAATLENIATRTDKQNALFAELATFRERRAALAAIDVLSKRLPKFMYTSHYDRMSGEISVTKLLEDRANNRVSKSDQIFLDFLEYAGTSLEELQSSTRYEDLKAKCEGASNDITDEIFEFWSQNEALAVQIDIGEGKAGDPAPFNSGTVVKIRIENKHHRVTVPLSERSAGFIWFFSFLAQFKQLKKTMGNAILLLDEPGLTLHGKAQSDLLKYIEERLLPEHQVLYTTHSPFMIPTDRLDQVRLVEDVIERSDRKVTVHGTKVSSDVLAVGQDTVFPLQAHLGYEITQALFLGPNTLLLEGPSDIVYLQVFSSALKRRGRVGLDSRWTMCPSGGIDKVQSFASLFGGNKLNVAVLTDFGTGDKTKVERLKKSAILNTSQIFTTSDFTGKTESDVEDLLATALYAEVVNSAYNLPKAQQLKAAQLETSSSGQERVVKAVEDAFRTMPATIPEFDHFTPADWLLRNPQTLDSTGKAVEESLDKFEEVFKTLNALLPTISR